MERHRKEQPEEPKPIWGPDIFMSRHGGGDSLPCTGQSRPSLPEGMAPAMSSLTYLLGGGRGTWCRRRCWQAEGGTTGRLQTEQLFPAQGQR